MSCINDQQQVSMETTNTTPASPVSFPLSPNSSEFLYGSKGYLKRASPDMLNKVMSNSSMSVRSAFLQDCERRRKSKGVAFASSAEKEVDYGYGETDKEVDYGYGEDIVPPPTKKRRYERRNSKTPRMLMAMNASLATLDFLNDDKDDSLFKTSSTNGDDDGAFDGGLQIAEELVKQLQTRRRRTALSPSARSA